MNRRDMLKGLATLPIIGGLAATKASPPPIPIGPPLPILYQIGRLNGVTAITRHWADGDEKRCRLCDECTAERGVCTILVERYVSDKDAPVFNCRGFQIVRS
jgi:hypothetical protein